MILEFTTFIGYEYSQSAFHFRKNLNYNVVFQSEKNSNVSQSLHWIRGSYYAECTQQV